MELPYGMNPLLNLEVDDEFKNPATYTPPAEDPSDRISAFFDKMLIDKLIKERPIAYSPLDRAAEEMKHREMEKAILGEDFRSVSSSVDVSKIKTELERTPPKQILNVAERLLKSGQTLLLFDGQIRVSKSWSGQVAWEDLTAK